MTIDEIDHGNGIVVVATVDVIERRKESEVAGAARKEETETLADVSEEQTGKIAGLKVTGTIAEKTTTIDAVGIQWGGAAAVAGATGRNGEKVVAERQARVLDLGAKAPGGTEDPRTKPAMRGVTAGPAEAGRGRRQPVATVQTMKAGVGEKGVAVKRESDGAAITENGAGAVEMQKGAVTHDKNGTAGIVGDVTQVERKSLVNHVAAPRIATACTTKISTRRGWRRAGMMRRWKRRRRRRTSGVGDCDVDMAMTTMTTWTTKALPDRARRDRSRAESKFLVSHKRP